MPSTGPTAWRLNKAELAQVETGLSLWEVSCDPDLSEEAKVVAMDDERRRLTREIQQVKHNPWKSNRLLLAVRGKPVSSLQLLLPRKLSLRQLAALPTSMASTFRKWTKILLWSSKYLGLGWRTRPPHPSPPLQAKRPECRTASFQKLSLQMFINNYFSKFFFLMIHFLQ